MRFPRGRGLRSALILAALASGFAGWRWFVTLSTPELVLWIRTARNDAGEPVVMLPLIKRSPLPLDELAGGIYGTSTGVVSGLTPLGDAYTARWVVNERDIYVVDAIRLRSLLPSNVYDIAGRGKGGSLLTRMTVLPEGRLRWSWILCPTQRCETPGQREEDFQGASEFQGRLEATTRYPTGD